MLTVEISCECMNLRGLLESSYRKVVGGLFVVTRPCVVVKVLVMEVESERETVGS
jgi:hypothetical protein